MRRRLNVNSIYILLCLIACTGSLYMSKHIKNQHHILNYFFFRTKLSPQWWNNFGKSGHATPNWPLLRVRVWVSQPFVHRVHERYTSKVYFALRRETLKNERKKTEEKLRFKQIRFIVVRRFGEDWGKSSLNWSFHDLQKKST